MGEKSYFATIKCIIYDFIDKNRRIFASVKTNGRCETSFHHLLLIQKNKTLEFNRDIEIPMFFLYTKLKHIIM